MDREPKFSLWLLRELGVSISPGMLARSFILRWLLGTANFLLTWGVLSLVVWGFLGSPHTHGKSLVVLAASLVYGLLLARAKPALGR